jgi:hypothetical protein
MLIGFLKAAGNFRNKPKKKLSTLHLTDIHILGSLSLSLAQFVSVGMEADKKSYIPNTTKF